MVRLTPPQLPDPSLNIHNSPYQLLITNTHFNYILISFIITVASLAIIPSAVTLLYLTTTYSVSHYHWRRQQPAVEMFGKESNLSLVTFKKTTIVPLWYTMYLAVCICLGVFDDVLKLQSSLQQHWLLTGDHLLVNGVVEVGYLHTETGQGKE